MKKLLILCYILSGCSTLPPQHHNSTTPAETQQLKQKVATTKTQNTIVDAVNAFIIQAVLK